MKKAPSVRTLCSIGWILCWVTVIIHVSASSRGRPDIPNPSPNSGAFRPDPAAENARVAILGDCHSFRQSLRGFAKAIDSSDAPDFAIQLGDFVDYDEELAYHHFLKRLGRRSNDSTPLYFVRGNHEAIQFDLSESDNYLQLSSSPNFHFVHAKTLWLFLDNSGARIEHEARNYAVHQAKQFRKSYTKGRIILFMHIPPSIKGTKCDDLPGPDTVFVKDFCTDYSVDYLIAGHVHESLSLTMGDTRVIIEGTGGGSIVAPSSSVQYLDINVYSEPNSPITIERRPLAREPLWIAKLDYLWGVQALRFRALVGIIAGLVVIREARHLCKTINGR